MIYTFMKISSREDAKLDRYWVDPSGIEMYVGNSHDTHGQWIFHNQQYLPQDIKDKIKDETDYTIRSEDLAGMLYELGWIRISENTVLMGSNGGMKTLASFISKHANDSNLDLSPEKKLTIIKMNPETHMKITIAQIMSKYANKPLQLAASFDKISSRDAVKDTINYWDKAKNKDFSKYWRKLKRNKKRKANYIPNPKTTVEQPLKKNYDYGEIPNYVDRIKWHNRKTKRNKRKAYLDTI